ncbi:MAG: hypothetical protein ABJF50_24630 [Paracoccaceae bacterium]|uniref:hypothetical protein n=1 Tax=Loktanella sp. F6476L TaxID=2926405 RepID=UPI001FF35F46|nr:hypothetical protein [Loktanella sp. F6476L]MCK0122680.1 hypothetical protein [Loktanella sp. F6476L]
MISVTPDALEFALKYLSLMPDDVQNTEEDVISYDFLEESRNGAFISRVTGDFSFALDIFIFDQTEAALRASFIGLSREGIDVSEPDETRNGPFDHIVYRAGKPYFAEVIENTESGDLRIEGCTPESMVEDINSLI